ncbi:MAG: TauD/TfdA family dioxygenase [Acidimicrobiales bacterium]|nr:TauD/TfdA family dioxygenase [Acidimicrobiales bacterium]
MERSAGLPGHPDFEVHPVGSALVEASVDGAWVGVRWEDGRADRVFGLLLYENQYVSGITSADTRQRQLEWTEVPEDPAPLAARVDGDGALEVTWSTGAKGRFHPGWLRHLVEGRYLPGDAVPAPLAWTVSGLTSLPTFDGPGVLAGDDEVLGAWCTSLAVHGIGRLEGLPTGSGTVVAVAERLGVVRTTHFGHTFEVVIAPENESNAYTSLPLAPHVDISTREHQPGLQLLHCLVNTCPDGRSVMVDGFAVVDEIRRTDPDAFEALTTFRWVHTNRSTQTDLRWSSPVVRLDAEGEPAEIRLSTGTRALPEMGEGDLPEAYRALRLVTEVAADPRFRITTTWRPGDLVCFRNGRVLHGREGFDPAQGERHLQGCYVDLDDLWSCLRMVRRRRLVAESGKTGEGG